MITNLLASIVVTLVTNTTERFPQHYVQDPSPISSDGTIRPVAYGHYENDRDPQKKWVKTTVKKVTTATIHLNGRAKDVADEEIISEVEAEYALVRTDDWKLVANPQPGVVWRTNLLSTNWIRLVVTNRVQRITYSNDISVLIVTNAASELPPGYKLQKSDDGLWRYIDGNGDCTWFPKDTREGAVTAAWEWHKRREKDRVRQWKSAQ